MTRTSAAPAGWFPWAGRLWVMTYAPHKPRGSTDKLYEISPTLERVIRPESIGGTPANRMIHRESGQLFLGPYVIDAERNVRVITPDRMPGRLTGNARHLTDPAHRIYCATMEEGFYEIDVRSLAVRMILRPTPTDCPATPAQSCSRATTARACTPARAGWCTPTTGNSHPPPNASRTSSPAASPNGTGSPAWRVVRRNQFTEVTGPGGLEGNPTSRIRSHLVHRLGSSVPDPHASGPRPLARLSTAQVQPFLRRCPWLEYGMAAHPGHRRERHADDDARRVLALFPKTFSVKQSAGIEPRANYLKVVGDFAHWNRRIVFGCDDSARSEFLNVRPAKGGLAPPGRSQSNLWFAKPSELDQLGPVIGRGTVWSDDDVSAGMPSDPFLFAGYDLRGLHLAHQTDRPVEFTLEVDRKGNGTWSFLRRVTLQAREHVWLAFRPDERGAWVRVVPNVSVSKATATFAYRNRDSRTERPSGPFRRAYRIRDLADGAVGGMAARGGRQPTDVAFLGPAPSGGFRTLPNGRIDDPVPKDRRGH
jgi:hypothetical protein